MTPAPALDGPLDPETFLGRSDVLDQIAGRLRDRGFQSASIVGGPRTGKTSLLRFISSPAAAALCPDTLRVYVDAEPLGLNGTPDHFWISVFRAAVRQAPSAELDAAVAQARQGTLDLYALEDLFDACAARKSRFVISIDNFENLLNNPNFWKSSFFHNARSLAQRLPRGVAYITGTTRPLLDLWDPTKLISSYYNVFANVLIARLTDADIEGVVRRRCQDAGIKEDIALLSLVAEASDRHPALVDVVTRYLVQRRKQSLPADVDSLAQLADDPEGPYVTLTRQIRAALAASERLLIDNIPGRSLTDADRRMLKQLQSFGLLPPGTEF